MPKNKKVTILLIVIAFALATTGAILFIGLGVYGESQTDVHAGDQPTATTIPPDIIKKRGPRPQNTRLRDNARQIETNQDALASAEDALARVEKELAGANDDAQRLVLERKKELIEHTIAKLGYTK